MGFELPAQLTPDFAARLEQAADHWNLTLTGTLDVADAAARVQPELLRLHDAALAAKVPRVTLAVQHVEYMNSSGLKAFMAWFLAASNTRTNRYTIEVAYDPNKSWQQLSFRPMERLAPNTVKLIPAAGAVRNEPSP